MANEEENPRTIEPVHQSVSKLLSAQQTYQAPRYQRNYAWGHNEISAFLGDLDTCVRRRLTNQRGRHHFFGGLVTVKAPVAGSTRVNLEVVDGQQRLATFAILISRLKRTLAEIAVSLDDGNELKPVLLKRADTLANSYEIYQDEIRLKNVEVPRVELSVPDRTFFSALLAGDNVEAKRKSHGLLKEADKRIGEYLLELLADVSNTAASAERLQAVHDVLKADWTIIHMTATARSDAYMLFQVLNDRGVSLTEGELLRSTTLEALEKATELPQIEEVEELWNEMLGEKTNVVTNAFGWLYASQLGNWPGRGTRLEDYIAAFFPSMPSEEGEMNRATADRLVEEIRLLSGEFHEVQNLIRGEWPTSLTQGVTAWERNRLRLLTKHLRYTDCISLLAAGCKLKPRKFVELVMLLERFAFRYSVIADAPADRARAVINRHAVDIRRDSSSYKLETLRGDLSTLVSSFADDNDFKSAVEQLRYSHGEHGNGPLKYLLLTLEDYIVWYDDNPQGNPVCRDHMRLLDFETGTIEHIYAQKVDVPDPSLDAFVDALGNLTLLSGPENDRVANKPYPAKRPILAQSTSTMNRLVAEEQDWTVEVIERRTAKMAEMALRIFRM